jgi:hypothetical protein
MNSKTVKYWVKLSPDQKEKIKEKAWQLLLSRPELYFKYSITAESLGEAKSCYKKAMTTVLNLEMASERFNEYMNPELIIFLEERERLENIDNPLQAQ